MKNYSAKDVEAYIASAGREARPKLKEIRKLIKATIPNVEEGISYGVPFYKFHGLLAGFAAHKNHASIWCPGTFLQSEDRKMLEEKGYKTEKKTIQIKFDQEVPTTFIKQLLKEQAKMNEARHLPSKARPKAAKRVAVKASKPRKTKK